MYAEYYLQICCVGSKEKTHKVNAVINHTIHYILVRKYSQLPSDAERRRSNDQVTGYAYVMFDLNKFA